MKLEEIFDYAIKNEYTDIFLDEKSSIKFAKIKEIKERKEEVKKEVLDKLKEKLNGKLSTGIKINDEVFARITYKKDFFNLDTFTIRLLYKKYAKIDNAEEEYKRAINRIPEKKDFTGGLILVCGETGSGKSSLIFGTLLHLAKRLPYLINTYENPVEMLLRDKNLLGVIRQYEEPDFDKVLYHFLLSSPKIGFVSEVKTKYEIENVIDLASRGHLIFTSIHATNVLDAIKLIAGSVDNLSLIKFAQNIYMIVAVRFVKIKNNYYQMFEVFVPSATLRLYIEEKKFKDIKRKFYFEPTKNINSFCLKFSESLERIASRVIKDVKERKLFIASYKKTNWFLFEDEKS